MRESDTLRAESAGPQGIGGRYIRKEREGGFFGRLEVEFFEGRDWSGWTAGAFVEELYAHIDWYNSRRLKAFVEGGRTACDTIDGRVRRLGWRPGLQAVQESVRSPKTALNVRNSMELSRESVVRCRNSPQRENPLHRPTRRSRNR